MKQFTTFDEARAYSAELAKELHRPVHMVKNEEGWAVDDRIHFDDMPHLSWDPKEEDVVVTLICSLCTGLGQSPLGEMCPRCSGEGLVTHTLFKGT